MALTDAQKEQQLRAVGWGGPTATDSVQAAWARTATPADQAAANPQATTPVATNQGGTYSSTGVYQPTSAERQQQEAAVLAGFKESSGFSREQLAESARQFNATLAQKQLEWQQQGLPELEIKQRTAALEDEKFRADLALAQQTQAQTNAINVAGLTGYYNAPNITPYGSAVSPTAAPAAVTGGGGTGTYSPSQIDQIDAQMNAQIGQKDWKGSQFRADIASGMDLQSAVRRAADTQQPYTVPQVGAPAVVPQATAQGATQVAPGVTVNSGAPAAAGRGIQTLAGNQQAFAQNQAQQQQAMDLLKFSSTLKGPENYFQSADFNRGVNASGQMPTFLNALASNTALPSFNAAGGVGATPLTAGSLAAGMTGGAAPGAGYSTDQALNQIGSIFKAGPTQLAAGSLERLDPNELALMKSGAGKLGYDYDSWLRNYQKSGIGQ